MPLVWDILQSWISAECWIVNLMLRPLEKMEGDSSPPFVLEIFHLKMCSKDLNILHEDFFMEIFPLKYGDFSFKYSFWRFFSIEVFKNFNEDLFIRDFSLKNWDFFFLKSYPLNIWNFLKKIYSWRFFLEDSFQRFFHCIF